MSELSEQSNIIKEFIKRYAGQGDEVSARQATEAVPPSAEQGDVKAQMLLGKYYSCGYHSDCDSLKAIYWFEKAADNGNAEAVQLIMEIYRSYTGGCPDWMDMEQRKGLITKWHLRWFDILAEKADKGSANAAKDLMWFYVEECPEDMTPEEGVVMVHKWYKRWIEILTAKATKGDFIDKMNLADILLYADGVPEQLLDCSTNEDDERNLLQAIKLYKEIAGSDCNEFHKSEAYYKMGTAYDDLGEGEKALSSFKKAAKLNCHEAYAKIGDAYRYGKGAEPDDATARKWYRKGADVGEITAVLRLAECYKNGIGGKQDYGKAMDNYLVLAERINGCGFKHQAAGIGTALYEIGNMYLNGHGVQPDLKKAIYYFKLAVKKGNNIQAENKLNELL